MELPRPRSRVRASLLPAQLEPGAGQRREDDGQRREAGFRWSVERRSREGGREEEDR